MSADPHHFVEWDAEWNSARFICDAPEGAPCRSLPICQHPGEMCSEREDGSHGEECPGAHGPVPLEYKDLGYCNAKEWIDNSEECGRGTVRFPVETTWEGDFYTWEVAATPVPTDALTNLREVFDTAPDTPKARRRTLYYSHAIARFLAAVDEANGATS